MRGRTTTRSAVASLIVAIVLSAAPVAAEPSLLPEDAAVVIAGSPDELSALLSAAAALSPLHAMSIGLGRQAATAELGWDIGDPAAWRARGFDPARRLWLSLSVGDGQARYQALTSARSWTSRTGATAPAAFWRVRLIAPVTDAARARKAVETLAAGLKGVELFAAVRRDRLIVDLVRPVFFGAGAAVSRRQMRAVAVNPSAGHHAVGPERLAAGVGAWMRSTALVDLGRAMQREFHVDALGASAQLRGSGPWRPNAQCAELRSLAERGAFRDLGVALVATTSGLEVRLTAAETTAGALRSLLPVGSLGRARAHRLAGASGAIATGLASLRGMRALERPPAFESFTDALAHIRGCESHYGWTARLFGWPQLVGSWADEIAALGPRGRAIVEALGPVAIGVSSWHREPMQAAAVVEGPLDPALHPTVASLFDLAFGPGERAGQTRRWGHHRVRPYLLEQAGVGLVGASLGGDAGARLATSALRPGPAPGPTLLSARFDLTSAGAVLRRWIPSTSLFGRARTLEIDANVSGPRLEASIRVVR